MNPRSIVRHRLAALPLSALLLSGCGMFGPATFEVDDRSIEVDAGDEFRLELPANPAIAEDWYLVSPHPDRAVVERAGEHKETEPSDPGVVGGGDGTQYFDFKAVKAGTTKIKLIHCPYNRCTSGTPENPDPQPTLTEETEAPVATGSPGMDPQYFIFTVTVQ
ncbi:protease inhibitor I42 family protein [Streptomyces sp. T-3]|nr:protease inhibitor I42 family protein [Streptomyces sp. T-3]